MCQGEDHEVVEEAGLGGGRPWEDHCRPVGEADSWVEEAATEEEWLEGHRTWSSTGTKRSKRDIIINQLQRCNGGVMSKKVFLPSNILQ